ncbi:cell attachment protein [Belerina virus]|uniref:Cell attachment protein n=1 Tax=Belerina virus TaxID=2748342 RepID=A0A7D5DKM1_9MONO|nr:cell attachment protein [Belerina virus]QKZ93218.1 cell attachment protein [Belerina virus]
MSTIKNGYFGTPQPSKEPPPTPYNTNCDWFAWVGLILGMLSALIIIILNVTTLVRTFQPNNDLNDLIKHTREIGTSINALNLQFQQDLAPRLSVLTTGVSYSLPSQVSSSTNVILSEIQKTCIPKFETNSTECPVVQNPTNSQGYGLIDRSAIATCIRNGGSVKVESTMTLTDYPSFIPGSTKPGGCIRIPTFSLGAQVYSYSHNVIENGCRDHASSIQYWSIGRVTKFPTGKPFFENTEHWFMNDGLNRKSCTTATSFSGAWLGCTIVTEPEREDYLTEGIARLSLAYQDIYGNRKEWFFSPSQIPVDREYMALYFAVGSGVVVKNKVYLLMYGGLKEPYPGDVYCPNIGCDHLSQEECNQASKPALYGGIQLVNAILSFDDLADRRPTLKFQTIPPSVSWMGAEGRLMYEPSVDKLILYLRSTSWNPFIQLGYLEITDPITIVWTPYNTTGRPGTGYCGVGSRCPKDCVTGVYTDAFPLISDLSLSITTILNHQTERMNPVIVSTTSTEITGQYQLGTNSQGAAYTTTTCFAFYNDIWCVSIVEMTPAAVGEYLPVPFVYKLTIDCPHNSVWSVVRRVGREQIKNVATMFTNVLT